MISFIKGQLDAVNTNSIVIDCNGIGYEISVGFNTLAKLPPIGSQLKINTYMQVRDDGLGLFGFMSKEELNMFNMLISVSGIGPKVAMNMLGTVSPNDIIIAIISGDVKAISNLPGIGKKIAGRLILELKDKIKTDTATSYDFDTSENLPTVMGEGSKNEAIAALTALGYSRSEALKAVLSSYEDNMDTQQIIKLALKNLSR